MEQKPSKLKIYDNIKNIKNHAKNHKNPDKKSKIIASWLDDNIPQNPGKIYKNQQYEVKEQQNLSQNQSTTIKPNTFN